MHSAEWLRGAYEIASRYAPMDVAMQINANLAEAEAREAGGPSLADQLAAAQAEVKERTTMAARAQEAMRYLLNGLPATDAIWAAYGNADSARAWLAARDASMKALGAAEAAGKALALIEPDTEYWGEVKAMKAQLESEAARLAEGE